MTEEPEAFRDSRFAAEISNRMRVPDRIMVAGENQNRSPAFVGVNGPPNNSVGAAAAGFGGRDPDEKLDMQVPDRILVAGGDQHIAAKSTPFEMQVENTVLPPTRHDIRVNTPPRSIRLDEHPASHIQNDEAEDEAMMASPIQQSAQEYQHSSRPGSQQAASGAASASRRGLKLATPRSTSVESESMYNRHASDPSMMSNMLETTIHGGSGHSLNPWDEIQIVRRQIAKLNHRLMAVELENQQQQQRELILTVLVSCYFVGKFLIWINRSP